MAIEVKRHMLQREYAWVAMPGDDPRARTIDARLLNRHEGYEVIPMIQKIVDRFGYANESDVHKIEALIREELPGEVRGRKRVFAWLVARLEGATAPTPEAQENEDDGDGGGDEAAPAEAAAAEAAAIQAAQAEAARIAAKRAAALEAKWRVPETWRLSFAEMKKKVAVYAAFEKAARHLAAHHEEKGELPATFSAGSEALAQSSGNPSLEIRITRYASENPPAGTYRGHATFATGDAQEKLTFHLHFEHDGDTATGSATHAAPETA